MPTAVLLFAFAIASRLVPHPDNMVPMFAIALFASARLPRFASVAVPLLAWVVSDIAIDIMGHGYLFYYPSRLMNYAAIAAVVALGWRIPKRAGLPIRVGATVGAYSLYFLLSNFAVWAGGEGFSFPHTFAGLLSTYAVGLPFYRAGLAAEVLGTVALFGADALLMLAASRRPSLETVDSQ